MRARVLLLLTPVLALLAAPASALALDINEEYKPQNEFKLDPWITIEIGGIDLSINKAVFYVTVACLLTILSMTLIARKMRDTPVFARPGRVQTVVEGYYGLIETITKGNLTGAMVRKWFPFLATVFLFIWFSNMLGYLPLPTNTEHKVDIFGLAIPSFALYAATANISVPLVLTFIVVGSYHYEGIKAKGPVRYLKGWVPAGVEGPAVFPIFIIEVISHFVRIVSLSVRLFANILAGHLLILFMGGGLVVLLNLAIFGSVILGLLTGTMAVAFFIFEVGLVATLQAFIFTTLAAIYLGGAVAEEH
jgi:F-type H+-transporting ATPase subunit a